MSRTRNLLMIAIAALFAVAACSDDDGGVSNQNQNDFNVGEADAGEDTGDEDADPTEDTGPVEDTGSDEDTGPADDTGPTEDTGPTDDAGDDDNGGWPPVDNDHNHSDPPAQTDCQETFGPAEACGGYAEGQWENGEVCTDFDIDDALAEFDCPDADVRTFDYWVADGSGTLELTDDTFDRDLQIIIDADFFIPESCLEFMGVPITCNEFEAGAEEFLDLTMDCQEGDVDPSEGGPGCDCVADEELVDQSGAGTLTVDADQNILEFEGEGTYHYCADDGVLNMRTTSQQDLPLTQSYTFAP